MRRIIITAGLTLVLAAACQSEGKNKHWSEARTEMEGVAQECLAEARQALAQGNFDKARSLVEEIRSEYSLALDAREEAILLLDSVGIFQATEELRATNQLLQAQPEAADSLKAAAEEQTRKIKFYQRKLEHDKKNRQTH